MFCHATFRLDGHHAVRAAGNQEGRVVTADWQSIGGDDRLGQVHRAQQVLQGGDLTAHVQDRQLPHHAAVGVGQSADRSAVARTARRRHALTRRRSRSRATRRSARPRCGPHAQARAQVIGILHGGVRRIVDSDGLRWSGSLPRRCNAPVRRQRPIRRSPPAGPTPAATAAEATASSPDKACRIPQGYRGSGAEANTSPVGCARAGRGGRGEGDIATPGPVETCGVETPSSPEAPRPPPATRRASSLAGAGQRVFNRLYWVLDRHVTSYMELRASRKMMCPMRICPFCPLPEWGVLSVASWGPSPWRTIT